MAGTKRRFDVASETDSHSKKSNEIQGRLLSSSFAPNHSYSHAEAANPDTLYWFGFAGVSAASMIGLKQQLAKKQQELLQANKHAGAARQIHRKPIPKPGAAKADPLGRNKNAGVAERDARDRSILNTAGRDRLEESRAALERKAAQYDKLLAGDYSDGDQEASLQRPTEGYLVDFDAIKSPHKDRMYQYMEDRASLMSGRPAGMESKDMARERERREWEERMKRESASETAADIRHRLIEEIEKQTKEERANAAAARRARELAEERSREKLKAAFLAKKLKQARGKT